MSKTVIHFLNVGHGDCTIIEHPSGRITMIDINNLKSLTESDKQALASLLGITYEEFVRKGSFNELRNMSWEEYYKNKLTDPLEYFKANFPGRRIFRYVQTHPDMDHMSGLHRFFWEEEVGIDNFWDVDHAKELGDVDFAKNAQYDSKDWATYSLLRKGTNTTATPHSVMYKQRFMEGSFWSEDGITVLSPTRPLIDLSDEKKSWNNVSYVFAIDHGGRRVLLTGDAVQEAWDSMVEHVPASMLKADVLKAAHHGRESGYHKDAVDIIKPHTVISSVGKKPKTDAHGKYKSHGANVYSTRSNGTIVVTLNDDGSVQVVDGEGNELTSLKSHYAEVANALFGSNRV